MPDVISPSDTHVLERLRTDHIIWMSTTRRDGRPHIVPVWFWWDGETILIFSKPAKQKIRNLEHSPYVMLAFDGTNSGRDVVMIEGRASVLNEPTAAVMPPAYIEKYTTRLAEIGWSVEKLTQDYSQPIRITPTKLHRFGI